MISCSQIKQLSRQAIQEDCVVLYMCTKPYINIVPLCM